MINISGINTTALSWLSMPFIISLFIWLQNGKLDKKSLKKLIASFSLFFVLSHILSYLISYLILFIYLVITEKKDFKFLYFNLFVILQVMLYLIISEVRFQLDYFPTDKELDAYVFYLFLSGFFSYLFSFCSFIVFMQALEQAKKKF